MEELEEKWERAFPLISFFFFLKEMFFFLSFFSSIQNSPKVFLETWAEDVMRTDIISHIWYLFFDWQQRSHLIK